MPSLATIARRDADYNRLVSNRRRPEVELAVEQGLFRIGDGEIKRLAVQLANMRGRLNEAKQKAKASRRGLELKKTKQLHAAQLDNERQRTQFVLYLGRAGGLIGAAARTSVTPWPELLGYEPRFRIPAIATEEGNDAESENEPVTTVEAKPAGAPATQARRSRFAERLLVTFPKWLKAFIMPIAAFFTTLSPLSSAILIVAVGVGAFFWAEYSRSSFEKMYNATLKDVDQLTKRNGELQAQLATATKDASDVPQLKSQIATLTIAQSTLKSSVSQLEKDKEKQTKDHQALVKTLTESHERQLAESRKDADAKLKEDNEKLKKENLELNAKVAELSNTSVDTAKEIGRLQEIEKTSKTLSDENKQLRKDIKSAEAESRTEQQKASTCERNESYLLGLVSGMKKEVDEGILVCDAYSIQTTRVKFRNRFNDLHKAYADYFNKNLIYRYGW